MKLIALGDIHARKKAPRNRMDNYWETFINKLMFVYHYATDNEIDWILQPGDLFDSAKCSHEVVGGVATIMSAHPYVKMICCVGQHDLHFHNPNNPNIPINVLMHAGLIEMGNYFRIDNDHMVQMVGWEQEIPEPDKALDDMYKILLTHRMMIPDGEPLWAAQEDYEEGNVFLRKNDFDLVISGDNHGSFVCTQDDRILINAGSVMRSTTSQIHHKPCFYVVDTDTRTFEKVEIPIKPAEEVLDFSKKEEADEIDENLTAFVDGLKDVLEVGMDYKTNVRQAIKDNKISNSVSQIINEVMEASEI